MIQNIIIDSSLKTIYPEIRLGCITFRADVKENVPELWNILETQIIPEQEKLLNTVELSDIEGIRSSREAYKAFGRNPGRYRVSSESLLRRIRSGKGLYHVNSVVDVNNLISIQTALSVGSYNLDKIEGDIILRKALNGEGYEGIGKDFIDMENMLVLCDDQGLFGSSHSDSQRALIDENAKNILTVIYCFSDALPLETYLKQASELLTEYAEAKDTAAWIVR